MSDVCTPFVACGDLDSRVLFQRSVYGPTLLSDAGELPFGALALRGAALRPYVDLHFELRWVPRDLRLGPISSVMTLAPTETVTVATRTEHRTTFTDLVRDATDRSSVSTHTRTGPEQASNMSDEVARQQEPASDAGADGAAGSRQEGHGGIEGDVRERLRIVLE